MRPGGLTVVAGGTPAEGQLAALAAALSVVLEEERAPAADPLPAAYRSRWRRAGIAAAVGPFAPAGGA